MKLISPDQRFVVFGARGMAGSAIYRALKKNGFNNILAPLREDLDLEDIYCVRSWFREYKPEVVILAAAKVGGIYANNNFPADFILKNLKIQNNVIESSWKENVSKLLFLGSSCIYPKFAKQPINEEELLKGALEPTNQWYAIAKIAGIKLCQALKKQHNFNAISLMPTNLYGPGDNYHPLNSHVLPSLIRRFYEAKLKGDKIVTCWGTGEPLREFLHVDDLGDACIFALDNLDPFNEILLKDSNGDSLPFLNVGTGEDISIRELAKLISHIIGFEGEILWDKSKPDGTPKKQLNVDRINKLGWSSKISLKQGLEKTIKHFKENY